MVRRRMMDVRMMDEAIIACLAEVERREKGGKNDFVGNHTMQSDFSRWTVAALGAELSARGLSKAGSRGELIERLGQDETEKSKKRKAPTDNDELLPSLECPICMDRIMPPLEQCTNGHVICGVCKPSVLKSSNPLCPECRVSLRSLSRNLLMEKVVSGLTVPCKNECGEMHLPYTHSREHEQRTCPLAPLQCPHVDDKIIQCDFRGDHTAMVAHCKERHNDNIICCQASESSCAPLTDPFPLWLDSEEMAGLLAHRSDEVRHQWSEFVQLVFHGNVCIFVNVFVTRKGVALVPTCIAPDEQALDYEFEAQLESGRTLSARGKVRGPREPPFTSEHIEGFIAFPLTAFQQCPDEDIGGHWLSLKLRFKASRR